MALVKQVPILRVLLPYVGGVLLAYPGELRLFILLLPLLCLLLLMLQLSMYLREKKMLGSGFRWRNYFPAMLLCFFSGMGSGAMSGPKDPEAPLYERLCVQGRISGGIREDRDVVQFLLEVEGYCYRDSLFRESFLVMVSMEGGREVLPGQGENFLLTGTLHPVKNSGNPGEVDFQRILSRKDRWYYMRIDSVEAACCRPLPDPRMLIHPWRLSARLSRNWEKAGDSGSLLKALCLGDKNSLERGLRQSYAAAGSAHILAVSGLHVGMLWWVLRHILLLLFPFRRARIPKLVLLLLLLWLYAALTGFAPPVNRSVSMLTLYTLASLMGMRTKGLNILLLSFFLLVLIKPSELYNMGFQLSYAAVFSIIIVQARISGLPGGRKGLFRVVRDLTAVSLAAQLGTFPLLLFHFHQFPLYSLLSNLLSFPLLSLILLLFVLAFPLLLFGNGGFLSELMLFLARILNWLMETIAAWPASVIDGIYPHVLSALLLQTIVIVVLITIYLKGRSGYYVAAFLLLILLSWSVFRKEKQRTDSRLVVQQLYSASLLTFKEGLRLDHYLWTGEEIRVARADRLLETCWGDRRYERSVIRPVAGPAIPGAVSVCFCLADGLWLLGNQNFRVVVLTKGLSLPQWEQIKKLSPDVVVLSGEPELEISYLRDPKIHVLLDGSCRRWYAARLKRMGLPYYNTVGEGAFVAVKKPPTLGPYQ